jgi:Peptidase family C25
MKTKDPLKVIVTSAGRLQDKYTSALSAVRKQLERIVAADAKRGIDTRIVYMDDAASTAKLKLKHNVKVTDRTCKEFVDALYKKHTPDYIMLFGDGDVFPFQKLTNPIYSPGEDDDRNIPSDLPYACGTGYKKNVHEYHDPSRVVGRLPDLPGKVGKEHLEYIKTLVDGIVGHKPRPASDYDSKYFAMSAHVWEGSTRMGLNSVFGTSNGLLISPTADAAGNSAGLGSLSHFINCHGDHMDPTFSGQKGSNYPTALHASDLANRVKLGTVVVAECCYGAQLFNALGIGRSIATSYLGNGALAYTGSSNIAYGDSDSQSCADEMCDYFMGFVLDGASTGRALLQARQKFLDNARDLDGYEQKTMGQFMLLGDPSLDLVKRPAQSDAGETVENRRIKLAAKGTGLRSSVRPARKVSAGRAPGKTQELDRLVREQGFGNAKTMVFATRADGRKGAGTGKAGGRGKVLFRTYAIAEEPKKTVNIPLTMQLEDQVMPSIKEWAQRMSRQIVEQAQSKDRGRQFAGTMTAQLERVAAPVLSKSKAAKTKAGLVVKNLEVNIPSTKRIRVLVVKMGKKGILGYRTYHSR